MDSFGDYQHDACRTCGLPFDPSELVFGEHLKALEPLTDLKETDWMDATAEPDPCRPDYVSPATLAPPKPALRP